MLRSLARVSLLKQGTMFSSMRVKPLAEYCKETPAFLLYFSSDIRRIHEALQYTVVYMGDNMQRHAHSVQCVQQAAQKNSSRLALNNAMISLQSTLDDISHPEKNRVMQVKLNEAIQGLVKLSKAMPVTEVQMLAEQSGDLLFAWDAFHVAFRHHKNEMDLMNAQLPQYSDKEIASVIGALKPSQAEFDRIVKVQQVCAAIATTIAANDPFKRKRFSFCASMFQPALNTLKTDEIRRAIRVECN